MIHRLFLIVFIISGLFISGCASQLKLKRKSIPKMYRNEVECSILSFTPHALGDTSVVIVSLVNSNYTRVSFESGCYDYINSKIKDQLIRDIWILNDEKVTLVVVQNEYDDGTIENGDLKLTGLLKAHISRNAYCLQKQTVRGVSEFSWNGDRVIHDYFAVIEL